MNKRERLMAVLNGEVPDRLPAGFWLHFEGEEAHGDACIEAHLRFYQETGIDFVKMMSDGLNYPLEVEIDKAEDWYNVKPLPRDHAFFVDTIDRCVRINEELAGECYTFYNFFSPFNVVRGRDIFTERALQGEDWDATVMRHLRENEDALRHALNVIAEDLAYLAREVIEKGGCLGIYQSLQGAEKGRMTYDEYARIVKPSDMIIIEAANEVSDYNILHLCSWAGHPNHLSYWRDYPSRVKNWGTGVEGMALAEGVSFFAPETVLLGGLDNRPGYPLVSGTEEEVKAEVRRVVASMEGRPFIVGADCTVPPDLPPERIRWVMEVLEE